MTDMPTQPITGPDVWTRADLESDDRWRYPLDAAANAELRAAVDAVKAKDLETFRFGRDDFPLPTLRARIEAIVNELEAGRGFVLVQGLDVDAFDMGELTALYWGLGVHMGAPVSQNARGDLIGSVKDSGRGYMEKNVRGYTTSAALPPHCDPADTVGLLCVGTAAKGGRSQIASGPAIFNEILARAPHLLPPLFKGFHFDLRGEGSTGDPDEVTRHRVPVFHWHGGRLSVRYNRKTIIDGMAKAGMPLDGDDLAAVDLVAEVALEDRVHYAMHLQRGDIQLLSNHAVLHFREAFENTPADTEAGGGRHMLRLWTNVDPDVARPLRPEFAERLNTGPRGGVHITDRHAGWVPDRSI